jgi:hypothetical protein
METVMVLATLAQNWRLRFVTGHPVALHQLMTLRPKYGMPMVLSKRPA